MRRFLRTFLLCFSFALAIVATGFHRSIDRFGQLRRFTHPTITYGNFAFLIALNNSGGISASVTQFLPTPMPWPADNPPTPNVVTGNEFLVAKHQSAGFFYARIDSAPKAFLPLDHIARIVVLPYPFVLILSLAYPLFQIIFRGFRRTTPATKDPNAPPMEPPQLRCA